MDTKAAQRQKLYKSTVDPADLRKRSQNARVSIRKQRREQNTQKRRALREDFEDENQCASPIKESAMQMVGLPPLFSLARGPFCVLLSCALWSSLDRQRSRVGYIQGS